MRGMQMRSLSLLPLLCGAMLCLLSCSSEPTVCPDVVLRVQTVEPDTYKTLEERSYHLNVDEEGWQRLRDAHKAQENYHAWLRRKRMLVNPGSEYITSELMVGNQSILDSPIMRSKPFVLCPRTSWEEGGMASIDLRPWLTEQQQEQLKKQIPEWR